MKKIFIINGESQSGKDTFIELAKEIAGEEKVESVVVQNTNTKLVKHFDSKHKILCKIDQLLYKYLEVNYRKVKKAIKAFTNSDKELMFICCKSPEQIKRLCSEFDIETILIRRCGEYKKSINREDSRVYSYLYDYIFINPGDSLADYKDGIEAFLLNVAA